MGVLCTRSPRELDGEHQPSSKAREWLPWHSAAPLGAVRRETKGKETTEVMGEELFSHRKHPISQRSTKTLQRTGSSTTWHMTLLMITTGKDPMEGGSKWTAKEANARSILVPPCTRLLFVAMRKPRTQATARIATVAFLCRKVGLMTAGAMRVCCLLCTLWIARLSTVAMVTHPLRLHLSLPLPLRLSLPLPHPLPHPVGENNGDGDVGCADGGGDGSGGDGDEVISVGTSKSFSVSLLSLAVASFCYIVLM